MIQGILRSKMKVVMQGVAQYSLELGGTSIQLNEWVGKPLEIEFTGIQECQNCQSPRVFADGYCYPCTRKLPQTDICQVRPELCHFAGGTCRDEVFADRSCFVPHIVYLSLSSHVKVGITRQTNIPTRFLDQGARRAVPLLRVVDRLTAGQVEVRLKELFSDRTSWQKMLKGEVQDADLLVEREKALSAGLEEFGEVLQADVLQFDYPLHKPPVKIKSLQPKKPAVHAGELIGLKGQYLILNTGVINMRKAVGYEVKLR